jgi:hypothetical protein
VISDLENGRRRHVTVAELIVFGYALGTAPLALLYPPPYDELVQALPEMETTRFTAAENFCGNDDGLIGPTDIRALVRARTIAEAKRDQQALLELLGDLPEYAESGVRFRPGTDDRIRRELAATVRQIKTLEAEARDDGR